MSGVAGQAQNHFTLTMNSKSQKEIPNFPNIIKYVTELIV